MGFTIPGLRTAIWFTIIIFMADLLTESGRFRHKVSSVLNGLAEYAGKVWYTRKNSFD